MKMIALMKYLFKIVYLKILMYYGSKGNELSSIVQTLKRKHFSLSKTFGKAKWHPLYKWIENLQQTILKIFKLIFHGKNQAQLDSLIYGFY